MAKAPCDSTFLYLFERVELEQLFGLLREWMLAQIADQDEEVEKLICDGKMRWVPFTGQPGPLTSLTLDGRNRVRPQCRPHGEFCLLKSCEVLHGRTSRGSGPG